MKSPLLFVSVFLLSQAFAQPVLVRNVNPVEVDKIDYPNITGNTTSSQAHPGKVILTDGSEVKGKITFFRKKGVFERVKVNTGDGKTEIAAAQIKSISLDPKIWEKKYPNDYKNPQRNFQPGYVVLPTGDKLKGKVAQVRDFSDYDFFIYSVLFLPEGSEVASTFSGGRINEFGQEVNGVLQTWDGYADGYLLRMVDGRYRMSRNPYSQTKNEFLTSLKNSVADSLTVGAARMSFANSIKNGNNINESMENAANTASVVSEVLGGIQINKKEYLIFDTNGRNLMVINESAFPDFAQKLMTTCGAQIAGDVVKWNKMEEFMRALNSSCR